MSLEIVALMAIILLFLLFTIGVPVAFSMALVGFIGFAYVVDMHSALRLVAIDTCETFANYGLTVVPLFILMGQIGANAGIAKRLYDTSYKFIGHIPGGLAMATVLGAVAFKAVCGSTPATSATFATVAIPEMDRYGYDKSLSTGTVATVGTLGVLLPPSVALIIYGIITEQSIGRLFLAGIIPGLIVALVFFLTILIWCKINPDHRPKRPEIVLEGKARCPSRDAPDPGRLYPRRRHAHGGLFHAHGGGQRRDLRGPSLYAGEEGYLPSGSSSRPSSRPSIMPA